jgi:hypothetical protein
MSQLKKNKKKSRFKIDQGLSAFLIALLVIVVIMFGVGYAGMGIIIKSITNHSSEQLTEEIEAEQMEIESNTKMVEAVTSFDALTFYALQVSSLSDEASAIAAVDTLSEEGLVVTYAKIGSYFKLFAGISENKELVQKLNKKVIERFPKYKDAYVTEMTLAFSDATFLSETVDGKTMTQELQKIITSYDEIIITAQIEDEVDIEELKKTQEAFELLLSKISLDSDNKNLIHKFMAFSNSLENLMERKANVREYNKLWLKTMTE